MTQHQHDLYKTGEPETPEAIQDRNGEVVLGLCKIDHLGEAELVHPCCGSCRFHFDSEFVPNWCVLHAMNCRMARLNGPCGEHGINWASEFDV